MTVQLELWQLITLLLAFFAAVGLAARVFLGLINQGLDDRFRALKEASATANSNLHEELKRQGRDIQKMQDLERQFLQFQAELPNQYVRRDDYIRSQTVIEGKIDRIVQMVSTLQIKGNRHDD
jgi:predicted Holliday junction resolvase-like endonuclease